MKFKQIIVGSLASMLLVVPFGIGANALSQGYVSNLAIAPRVTHDGAERSYDYPNYKVEMKSIALLGSKELLIEDNYKILRVSTLFLRFFKYMLVAILIIIFIMVCLIIIKKWRDEHLSNHILYLLGYRNVHIYLLMTGMWLIFLLFSCGLGFLFSSTVINNILSNVLQKKLELSIHIPYHAYLQYAGNSILIITPMILLANFFVIRAGRSGRYKI